MTSSETAKALNDCISRINDIRKQQYDISNLVLLGVAGEYEMKQIDRLHNALESVKNFVLNVFGDEAYRNVLKY